MKPENPEVLDADGAPIRVGDKLYFVYGDGTPLKCIGFDIDGGVIFRGWEEKETFAYENATVFTHKKPDSWEQLEKEAMLAPYDYCRKRGIDHKNDSAQKLKVGDIIRRAKALAGFDDERL